MADRYQSLSRTPVGAFLVKRLGLPDPVPLRRFSPGDPLVTGPLLVAGDGRVVHEVIRAAASAGVEALTSPPPDGDADLAAIVFDATFITSWDRLVSLQQFFSPLVRRLRPCGRVVVVGTTPRACHKLSGHVAQRALEGFTRSLGKELGRGSTVQLVYVDPDMGQALSSTLLFLLSAKSAYVSGQVIGVREPVAPARGDDGSVGLDDPLAGTVALVTGASRGIGAAIARTLHRDGARVLGLDVPQAAAEMESLAKEIGGERISVDITSIDAPQRIARRVRELSGGVDIVVHNAGITRDRRLANLTTEGWTEVMAVNLGAPERLTEVLLDNGQLRPNGRVIAVSSIAGLSGNVGQTNYATSKAGVIGLVERLAGQVEKEGITVNAVAPGFIETQLTAGLPRVIREAGRRMNSMRQGGLPVDVAETVAWLAHPGSGGVTGNTVRVCGQSLIGA